MGTRPTSRLDYDYLCHFIMIFPQGILQATFLCLVWPIEVVQNLKVIASNMGYYRNSSKKLNSFQNGMLLWQLTCKLYDAVALMKRRLELPQSCNIF